MMRFNDFSLRKKITLLLMGVSMAAAVAACLIFYLLIIGRYQDAYRNDLHSLAAITAANCRASLSFDIAEDAEHLLAALHARPSLVAATIHDHKGNLFASYVPGKRDEVYLSPVPPAGSSPGIHRFSDLVLVHDIEMNGQIIGTIALHDDMRSIRSFKHMALAIAAAIVVVVLGLTALCARQLREIISKPISNLVSIAQEITTKQDYSLRAIKESTDEVGHLVDAFNTMLSCIGQRNDALQRSENRFRSFVNQAVDAFFLHDMDGRIVDVNQRACDCLGYSREELLAMTVADIARESPNELYANQPWAKMIPDTPITLQGWHRRKDGGTFPVEVRAGLLDLGGEKLVMNLARDISERREAERERQQLESQLQQAQKMESIGTLAGGIAHDFNNILTPVLGYVELALMKTSDPGITKDLHEVKKAGHRAAQMVKQILAFSRRDSENIAPIEVPVIVKEALKLLRASLPSTIEIRQRINSQCGAVLANPSQIHQIVMNLCTNAYYAMRETGGILSIDLAPMEISSNNFMSNINLKPGKYLRLEVSDTGHGIDKDILQRIFEPYFTTKPKGEGTGMGLSVVHGVVKKIGGDVTVYSEAGNGTTFHIYLPAIESSISQAEFFHESPLQTGTERIMIVDDDATVASAEQEMALELGYEVKVFTSPVAALQHFTEHPLSFDLIITDMTMPKMTGDKLAAGILAVRPDMPVILCSGFSDLINEKAAKAQGIREYLTKPIEIHTLARTVRRVLDQGNAVS